jgi:hypothetical protein
MDSSSSTSDHQQQQSQQAADGLLVRALFDFSSTDGSSLSFRAGDLIHVYHQLETGWWDGVFDGCRGCVLFGLQLALAWRTARTDDRQGGVAGS